MKTKQPTPFYLAAERFAESQDTADSFGVCEVLYNRFVCTNLIERCKPVGEEIHKDFFQNMFMPRDAEKEEYFIKGSLWMGSKNANDLQNRQDRIIALLFADLMWQDEQSKLKTK